MSLINARVTRVLPRDFASGRNPCGGNNNIFKETDVEKKKNPLHIPEIERNDYGNFRQRSTQVRGVMGRKITPTLL